MRNKIIIGVAGLALTFGSFIGGMKIQQFFDKKDNDAVFNKSANFVEKIETNKLDDAYNELGKGLKDTQTKEQFKEQASALSAEDLSPGVMQVYQSGVSYTANLDIIDKNGDVKKNMVLLINKIDKEFVIISYYIS